MNLRLREACISGNLKEVKYLCKNFKNRIDLSTSDNYCIRWTCYYGRFEIVKYLCENFKNEIDLSAKNNYCIVWACRNGRFKIVQYLLENFGDDIDLSAEDNGCIRYACRNRKIKLIKYLLNKYSNRIYLDHRIIKNFTEEVKRCLMEVMGPKVLYVGKDSYIIDVEQYKAFFESSRDIIENEDHKLSDDGSVLVYSEDKKYEKALEVYGNFLSSLSKKSARK